MMRRALPIVVVACIMACASLALAAEALTPFDMSPEHGTEQAPAATGADQPTPPPAPPPASDQTAPVVAAAPPPAQPAVQNSNDGGVVLDRAILPYHQLVLEGEIDSRAWNVVLTRNEASGPAILTLGYKASVVVAPETSRLSMIINNQLVLDEPIAAADHLGTLTVQIPPGLLQAGPNLFRLQATQRHRTDCTIGSTYELRTEIDNKTTALHFKSPTAGQLTRIEDISATGPDTDGTIRVRIVAPGLSQKAVIVPALRYAQIASILIAMPSQAISIVDKPDAPPGHGTITAAVGTADDLRSVVKAVPPDAATRPIVTFVDDPVLGPSTLVISGPTTSAVSQAVDAIAALVDRPQGVPRDVLETSRWAAPNPPLMLGADRAKLSALGVFTQEFSGRRFKTAFQIGIPSDFYAAASGEATLLLDAAYSSEVLPGSHLDVYINDHIAATTPITTSGGEILRHLPIRIPMTHFRPGPNRLVFEAQLRVAADVECAAGPSTGNNRFVLFDTSEFVMPSFARVAQLPNLAALQGTGFPYNRPTDSTVVVLSDSEPDLVSATATLLGRMALAAGRVIPVELGAPSSTIDARNAIFVAPASQIPTSVLSQLDLDSSMGTAWKAPEGVSAAPNAVVKKAPGDPTGNEDAAIPDAADTQQTFDRWRNTLSSGGAGWRGNISSFQDWLQRTFQLSQESLRFLPSKDVAYQPPRGTSVVIAQGSSVRGDEAWTLLTAPTSRLLREGVDALTADPLWFQLAGPVVSYNAGSASIQALPVSTYSFIATQPTSLANARLIAANWLSENILAFSLLLFAACLLLGLATALFLSRLGRKGSA